MKKILFVALGATLLAAGCQKTEIIGLDNSQNGPAMTFSTVMKKITKAEPKADGIDDYNLEAQGFNVWAYADFDYSLTPNVKDGFYDGIQNLHVTYVDTNLEDDVKGSWNTGKEYYWPGKDKNLRFYAVSAAVSSGEQSTLKYVVDINPYLPTLNEQTEEADDAPSGDTNDPENGGEEPVEPEEQEEPELRVNNFAVNPLAPNEDLMVADFVTQNQEEKTVDLTFHHTLAKVEFLFKTATSETETEKQPKVYVQKITVNNMLTTGNLEVKPSADGELTVPDSFEWKPTDKKETFTTESTKDEITLKTGETLDYLAEAKHSVAKGLKLIPTITSATNGEPVQGQSVEPVSFATWLMLPQSLDSKIVEIIYVINNRQFIAKFPLAQAAGDNLPALDNWAVNSYTKYTVSLLPNLISFTATSNPWTPYNSSDTNEDGDDINLQN